jgi:antirestriction protein
MTAATTTPRVWIGCLASYNAGRLIGEWCEATDVDVMNDTWEDVKVQAVRAARAAGEYPVYFGEPEEPFLADNEGFGFQVGEYPDWSALAKVGALIEQHGEDFVAFLSWIDGDPLEEADELEDRFAEAYCGSYDDERAAAYDLVSGQGLGELPPSARWTGAQGDGEQRGWGGAAINVDIFDALGPYLDWDLITRELFDHGPYSLVDGVLLRGE